MAHNTLLLRPCIQVKPYESVSFTMFKEQASQSNRNLSICGVLGYGSRALRVLKVYFLVSWLSYIIGRETHKLN